MTITTDSLVRIKRPAIADDATELVGNTPLVRLARFAKGTPGTLIAKLEAFNPGFSVKDRIGMAMIEDAEAARHDHPGNRRSSSRPAATPASRSPSWPPPRATS